MKKNIGIDISSGDRDYKLAFSAAVRFANDFPDWKVFVFAEKNQELDKDIPQNITVVKVEKIVSKQDTIINLIRDTETTLTKGIDYLERDEISGFVSAGPSPLLIGVSYIKFKTFNERLKPAYSPIYCGFDGVPRIVTDSGANLSFDAGILNDYATMTTQMARSLGIAENPKVKLLNIGHEENKGEAMRLEAYKLLSNNKFINFKGNIEADNIMKDSDVDIVITDAITGNILVKSYEGLLRRLIDLFKDTKKTFKGKMGLLATKKTLLDPMKLMMNESVSGGALILGLNKLVVKAHGSSNDREFYNSMTVARKCIETDAIAKMKENVNSIQKDS